MVSTKNVHHARYVQVGESWTKKKLVSEINKQHSVFDLRTVCDRMERIIEAINYEPKPIIIDEADYLISGNKIELIREIRDETHCPIVLLGEGQLSIKLRKFERVHNRVLRWVFARKYGSNFGYTHISRKLDKSILKLSVI